MTPSISSSTSGGWGSQGSGSSGFSVQSVSLSGTTYTIEFSLSVSMNNGGGGTGNNTLKSTMTIVNNTKNVKVTFAQSSVGCSSSGGWNEGGGASASIAYSDYYYK